MRTRRWNMFVYVCRGGIYGVCVQHQTNFLSAPVSNNNKAGQHHQWVKKKKRFGGQKKKRLGEVKEEEDE